jgi:hypothetical protein
MIVELSKNFILKLQVIIFVKPVVLQIKTKLQLNAKKLIIGICLFDKKLSSILPIGTLYVTQLSFVDIIICCYYHLLILSFVDYPE